MSQYAHLSIPDSELSGVQLPQNATTIQERRERAALRTVKISFPQTQLGVKDWKIPVQDGEILVRSYVPQEDKGQGHPLLVWTHGGGFCTGGIFSDDAMLQQLAVDLKISVVNVDYRLAPEHPFPAGLNDTYSALKWAYENREKLAANTEKGFILGGCSAGGSFTAVLTHRVREDPELRGKLTGQILQVPMVVHTDAVPEKYKKVLLSLEQNRDAPILNQFSIQLYLDKYVDGNVTDPEVSPILWDSHKNLPPAYFQVCGWDPLRDEGLLYEKLLKEEGIKTKLDIYPGLPHAFEIFFPKLKQSAKWNEDLRQGIRWLLSV